MKTKRGSRIDVWFWLPIGIAILMAILALTAAPVPADADRPSGSKRTQREIDIFRRTLDDVLVDSRAILVNSERATDGIYIPEFGAVFHFDMNLVSDWGGDLSLVGRDFTFLEKGDDRIVIHRDHRSGGDDDADDDGKADKKEKQERRDTKEKSSWWEKKSGDAKSEYERGKKEIVDTLVDYGDMLTSLSDAQWVMIVADLQGSEYFEEQDLSQFVAKARLGDIRAFAKGEISEDALRGRIVTEEQ